MNKRIFCLSLLWIALLAPAQTIAYHNLKDLVEMKGDTVLEPRKIVIEKRSKSQLLLTNGADFKITSNRKFLSQYIKSRCYAIRQDSDLYINCRKLKIKKFRFGGSYASAFWVNSRLYFCALPIGPAAASISDEDLRMGALGDAIANSTIVAERVCYEINTLTGEVEFIGKEKMLQLLDPYPDLKEAYLSADSEEAPVTKQYLYEIKKRTK